MRWLVIVFEKPDGGFRKVVTAMKEYSSHELKIDIKKNNNDSFAIILSKFNLMLIYDVFVVLFAICTIVYYLKK